MDTLLWVITLSVVFLSVKKLKHLPKLFHHRDRVFIFGMTCVILMTRPFWWYHEFWKYDLDLNFDLLALALCLFISQSVCWICLEVIQIKYVLSLLKYFNMSYCPLLEYFTDFAIPPEILTWNLNFCHVWHTFTWVIALC